MPPISDIDREKLRRVSDLQGPNSSPEDYFSPPVEYMPDLVGPTDWPKEENGPWKEFKETKDESGPWQEFEEKGPWDEFKAAEPKAASIEAPIDAPGTLEGLAASILLGGKQTAQAVDVNRLADKVRSKQIEIEGPKSFPAHGIVPGTQGDAFGGLQDISDLLPRQGLQDALKADPKVTALTERIGERQGEMAGYQRSPAVENWNKAKGWDAVKAFASDPIEVTANIMAESAAGSAAGVLGATAGGLTVGPAGSAAGAGVGSFALEYASKTVSLLQEAGVDFQDPKKLLEALADDKKMGEIRTLATLRGLPIAALNTFSAGIAGKFFGAALKAGNRSVGGIAKASLKEAGQQVATEGGGEFLGQMASGEDLDLKGIFAEIIGGVPGGGLETVVNVYSEAKKVKPMTADALEKTAKEFGPAEGKFVELTQPNIEDAPAAPVRGPIQDPAKNEFGDAPAKSDGSPPTGPLPPTKPPEPPSKPTDAAPTLPTPEEIVTQPDFATRAESHQGQYGSGRPGLSREIGANTKTPEALKALKSASAELEAKLKVARDANDNSAVMDLKTRKNIVDEAIESATVGDDIRKSGVDPNYVAPMALEFKGLLTTEQLSKPAQGAIIAADRSDSPGIAKSQWQPERVTVESLKPSNLMLWGQGKAKFTPRKSASQGPIVVSAKGEVIDGNNRLYEAIQRGDKTIEIVREVQGTEEGRKGNDGEQSRTTGKPDAFERARQGEESAFEDLDEQFRKTYPDADELSRPGGRPNPSQVHTPQAFVSLFDRAFAARDFDSVLDAVKATSDKTIWKPYLQRLFSKQAADPVAAAKAEWFRHVFAGTVPADAIPRAAQKPPPATGPTQPPRTPPRPGTGPVPRPGGTPPPKPGSTKPPGGSSPPPSPPPQRIAVEPIKGGGAKSPYKIIEDFSAAIGKSIRVLRLKKRQIGVYRPGSTLTAERFAGDLDTAAHELAGHWADDKYGIGKPWIAPRTRSPYDTELAQFWIHGSVTPSSTLRYRRAEGIAEFIRAYVVNPTEAKRLAPKFAAYFEQTLPKEALKAINDFGKDVRTWAGEEPIARSRLNFRMNPPSLRERLWRAMTGRGFGFETSIIDKLRLMFDDPYHYAVKANKAIAELRGGKRLPQEDFELLARLLATHDARMSDQFEFGLVPLRPGQKPNSKGELDVERLIDPVTKEPLNLPWLLGSFDTKNLEAMELSMVDTSSLMVHERTLEKAKQFGRESNISGMGAGMMTDVETAKEFLAALAKDPARESMLKEAARRYRYLADQNINMLVESGRMSAETAREIRDKNEHYVDMHRLSEEFDIGNWAQRGGGIGTTADRARRKRFKGSSLEINNVYSNLLEQTDSIQREAHRNVTMNAFTDGLRNVRELHGADLKDFDQFGRNVTSADRNTIAVYKDGRVEHWQFAPEIFESLKGLGELGTHAFIDIAAMPSQFARYMITHSPAFIARNVIRDTAERTVQSRNDSKPWDILQGYSQAELSRYEVFGGGQFGNYIVDRHVWNRELKKVMRDLAKDPRTIFISPLKLKNAWEALSSKSEKLGRIAEFRRAFDHGKKELGYDDYNAALYAAGEARGLLDFAKAGTVMRPLNRLILFSNAAMRGLGRTYTGIKENPAAYAMRWGLYVLAPTLGVMAWNRRDDDTWDEYLQFPAYRKDMFWNLKMGSHWISIPKPHLLGVLSGGVERAAMRILGDKRAMEGYVGSVASQLPIRDPVEGTGPLKLPIELLLNRDTFRDRDIIPIWERDLKLELRKGTEHASGAGKGIAEAFNLTGLTIDPRQVDHVLGSYGGIGQIVTGATRKNQNVGETAIKATGLVSGTPGSDARDVQWVLDWAKENKQMQNPSIKSLQALRKSTFEVKDADKRDEANRRLRKAATQLRNQIDRPQGK